MGVSESTFRKVAQVADELIRYSPATAAKIHQLGYDDVEKIEAQLKAIERPEYREQRERLERMNNVIKTSDMVSVVRCGECKHRIVNENYGKKGYVGLKAMCELDTGDIFELGRNAEDDNWFCADGERKDSE